MQIPAKELYRVDPEGKYGGVVLVDPQVVPSEGGGFEVVYPAPIDLGVLVDEPPPSDLHVWDGSQWVEPIAALPEPPRPKLYHRIDIETGLILEPVIVEAGWVGDLREWRFVVPLGFIEEPVDQTAGFYSPKWDFARRKWVEGGEPPVIAPMIDWVGFVDDYTASSIDDHIYLTTNSPALTRLNRLLARVPSIDFDLLVAAFNDCVGGLVDANQVFVDEVKSLVAKHGLPVTVGDDGRLAR
jgi:hypothetical protein